MSHRWPPTSSLIKDLSRTIVSILSKGGRVRGKKGHTPRQRKVRRTSFTLRRGSRRTDDYQPYRKLKGRPLGGGGGKGRFSRRALGVLRAFLRLDTHTARCCPSIAAARIIASTAGFPRPPPSRRSHPSALPRCARLTVLLLNVDRFSLFLSCPIILFPPTHGPSPPLSLSFSPDPSVRCAPPRVPRSLSAKSLSIIRVIQTPDTWTNLLRGSFSLPLSFSFSLSLPPPSLHASRDK